MLIIFTSSHKFLQDTDPALTQAVVSRLLGNTSASSATTTTDAGASGTAFPPAAPSAAIPNPVLKFLNSREEPKAVTIKSEPSANLNVDIRKMHQAGGYDFGSYEQRNWSEIMLHTRNQRSCI